MNLLARPISCFGLGVGLLSLMAIACSSTEEPSPAPAAKPRPAARHNVRKAAVPAGSELSCADLLPDAATGELLGKPVAVTSRPSRGGTAVCSIALGETVPTAHRGNKMTQPASTILPGDELCEVSINCSLMLDADSEVKACTDSGGISDRDIGAAGCLRQFQGERYSYATLDHDTGCRYDVVAGGKLKGDDSKATIRACAQAAVDAISTEDLTRGGASEAPGGATASR